MTKMLNIGHFGRTGPGPGKYLLPTNVGYANHDATRYRNPMYSMAPKIREPFKSFGPGPTYHVDRVTRVGKVTSPTYSISSRPQTLKIKRTPGPAEYYPKTPPVMPAYSMTSRYNQHKPPNYPGPDKYMLPTTIGPKVPDKHANAAYSMSYKHHNISAKSVSPGPATYTPTPPSIYKQKLPNYTMRPWLEPLTSKSHSPGPKYYPRLDQKTGFSFGMRLTTTPYITAADDIPCI